MAKPVRCRRSPATVSAVPSERWDAWEPGRPAESRCLHPRVKGTDITWLTPGIPLSPSWSSSSPSARARTPATAHRPMRHPPHPRTRRPTPSPSAAAAFPAELTDDADRTITIEAEPERIVSLAPSNTEIVCALDACDRLVGVTDFDDYPPEVADVTDVVIQTQVDVELVVDAEPDLVLAAGNELTPSTVIEQLEELGLTVLVLYPESLDEVYDDIRARRHRTRRDGRRRRAGRRHGGAGRRRRGGRRGRRSAAHPLRGLLLGGHDLHRRRGLVPRVADRHRRRRAGDRATPPGSSTRSRSSRPIPSSSSSEAPPTTHRWPIPLPPSSTVAARPGWADLAAVQSGDVVPYLEDIVTTRPGPRIVDGLEALARAIHPDLFE